MRHPDILIHIDETLTHDMMDDVATSLYDVCSIIKAETTHADHILKVEYDENIMTGLDVLNRVKSAGVHAEIIGI